MNIKMWRASTEQEHQGGKYFNKARTPKWEVFQQNENTKTKSAPIKHKTRKVDYKK